MILVKVFNFLEFRLLICKIQIVMPTSYGYFKRFFLLYLFSKYAPWLVVPPENFLVMQIFIKPHPKSEDGANNMCCFVFFLIIFFFFFFFKQALQEIPVHVQV